MEQPRTRVNTPFTIAMAVLLLLGILLVMLAWASKSRATEYSMVDDSDKRHCAEYAERESIRFIDKMPAMVQAYADCISILPTRLELPPLAGTVPASADPSPAGETWAEACDREYRTWDETTGTVIRRGSPDRVECPLELIDGVWQLPSP